MPSPTPGFEPPAQPARAVPAAGARLRRAAVAVAALVASALLHWLALQGAGGTMGVAVRPNDRPPVEVALVSPPPPPPPPAAVVPAESAAAPVPARKPVRPRPPRPPRSANAPSIPPVATAPEPAPSPAVEDTASQAPATEPAPAPAAEAAPPPPAEASAPAAPGPAEAAPAPVAAETGPHWGVAVTGRPPSGRWRFKVYVGEYSEYRSVASLELTLDYDGDQYRMRSQGQAEGLTAWIYSGVLTQASEGRWGNDGFVPERFSEQRGKRPERWARVDPAQASVEYSGGERSAWVAGTQDRLSVLFQLGALARSVPERFAAGSSVDLPELTTRRIERVRYLSEGEETLATDDGQLRTLRLVREDPTGANDPRVEVWLGYDQQMLPVRIRLTDANGRVLDQLVQR